MDILMLGGTRNVGHFLALELLRAWAPGYGL